MPACRVRVSLLIAAVDRYLNIFLLFSSAISGILRGSGRRAPLHTGNMKEKTKKNIDLRRVESIIDMSAEPTGTVRENPATRRAG